MTNARHSTLKYIIPQHCFAACVVDVICSPSVVLVRTSCCDAVEQWIKCCSAASQQPQDPDYLHHCRHFLHCLQCLVVFLSVFFDANRKRSIDTSPRCDLTMSLLHPAPQRLSWPLRLHGGSCCPRDGDILPGASIAPPTQGSVEEAHRCTVKGPVEGSGRCTSVKRMFNG